MPAVDFPRPGVGFDYGRATLGLRAPLRCATRGAIAALLVFCAPAGCARPRSATVRSTCARAATSAVALVELPGEPFQAIPTRDGCYVFVSLAGPVEPGDPRRPPRPGAPAGGVALVDRSSGEPRLVRVQTLEGSPYGMVLTHDGQLLIVASDDRVAFLDAARFIAGAPDAVRGYLKDAPLAGRFYANVTADDRWLFMSDESDRSISVMDLERARANGFDARAVVGRIPTGRAPIALSFSPDDRLLYSTSQEAPASYQWPAVCRAPGSDTTRFPSRYPKGSVMVIDVARATRDPSRAVLGAVAAGCNPVRLVTSPAGDLAYVTARSDDELLVFDTKRLLSDTAHALIGRVPVGKTPVGVTTLNAGRWVAVTNSNRFAAGNSPSTLTIIDAHQTTAGAAAVVTTLPTGAFPRELTVTHDQRTLLLTNFDSRTLAVIDVARLPFGQSPIGNDVQRAPMNPATTSDSAPELRSHAEAKAWFETRLAPLAGSAIVSHWWPADDSPGLTRFFRETYEDVHLDECVLRFTSVIETNELPGRLSGDAPARGSVTVPLRDLDLSNISVRQLRDPTALRRPLIVGMTTTRSAGPSITWRGERTYTNRGLRLYVESREEGNVVVRALLDAAALCGAVRQ